MLFFLLIYIIIISAVGLKDKKTELEWTLVSLVVQEQGSLMIYTCTCTYTSPKDILYHIKEKLPKVPLELYFPSSKENSSGNVNIKDLNSKMCQKLII